MGIPTHPRTYVVERSNSMAAVFGWMAAGLGITALISMLLVSSPALFALVTSSKMIFYGAFILELVLVVAISGFAARMGAATAAPLFLFYSALNGITLSGIFLIYTQQSISSAFVTTAGTFAITSGYGIITKRDLTSVGSFCFMGLVGIVLASLVNMFLHSGMLQFIVSGLGLIVFIGLIAHDSQKYKGAEGAAAISGALSLYLDFVNLFLIILRLFGNSRD